MFQGKYHLLGVIGEGTYGRVYQATKGPPSTKSGPPYYAVKMIKKSQTESERPMVTSISTLREVKLLRELKHRNVVNLTDVLVDVQEGELALVFEFAEWTMRSLIDYHKRQRSRMPEHTVKSLMWQALRGLQYTHENWVIHRDLKPQNVLVIGEGKHRGLVQVADFGLARIYQSPVKPLGQVDKTVVTLWYRAPELLLGSYHYTTAVDIWSMGCIFGDLLLAENPGVRALFPGTEEPKEGGSGKFEKDQCDKIFVTLGMPNKNDWPDVEKLSMYRHIEDWQYQRFFPQRSALADRITGSNVPGGANGSRRGGNRGGRGAATPMALDLLAKMLIMNPSKRITAKDALNHSYFTEEWPKPSMNAVDTPSGTLHSYPIPRMKPLDSDVASRQQRHSERTKAISKGNATIGATSSSANQGGNSTKMKKKLLSPVAVTRISQGQRARAPAQHRPLPGEPRRTQPRGRTSGYHKR